MANYLYNGIELPALPNWDKTLYPYVYITNGFLGIGRSYVCFQTIQYGENANGYYSLVIPAGTGMSGLYSDNQWSEPTVTTEDKSITIPNDTWIWANFDVLNEDGSVFLAATDPLPVGKPITDPLSFAMGWQLGCRLRAQRAVREPIGYSYNGVVLPELPEVEGNRFVVLVDVLMVGIVSKTALFYMDTAAYFASNWLKVTGSFLTYTRYDYNKETDSWDLIRKDHSMTSDFSLNSKLVWGNYDVTDGNGNVVMEKTDPVPVYE